MEKRLDLSSVNNTEIGFKTEILAIKNRNP